ncbi:MAG: hypothetical protein QGH77_01715 [Planctomycetota bacterium]|nr:hypothetical protein [Planctomycetota bacterium]
MPNLPFVFFTCILASPIFAQGSSASAPLWRTDGVDSFEALGMGAVPGSYDLNGDGLLDIVTKNEIASTMSLSKNGSVQAHSGADGHLLWRRDGLSDNEKYGSFFSLAGDLNGDGVTDFFHREPNSSLNGMIDNGLVEAVSGKNGLLLWTRLGASDGEMLGSSGSLVSDTNGDGVPDIAIGIPGSDTLGFENNGLVEIVSGANGNPIWSQVGLHDHDQLGMQLTLVADIDGDGVSDLVAATPEASIGGLWRNGFVMAISGANGTEIWRLFGSEDNSLFGDKVADVPDVNGDSVPDLLFLSDDAFALGRYWNGTVDMISGLDGSTIWGEHGNYHNDHLGDVFKATDDLSGDGIVDVVLVASNLSTGGKTANGALMVLSGVDGAPLWLHEGTDNYGRLGETIVIQADLDGDGVRDVIAPTPNANSMNRVGNGVIQAYSGLGGSPIWRLDGGSNSAHIGDILVRLADISGDGVLDFISGSEFADSNGLSNNGRIFAIDGSSGATIWSMEGETSDARLGARLDRIEDLDGDSVKDLVSCANRADVSGMSNNGSARSISGATGAQLWRYDGLTNDDRFGWFVFPAGDLDGDLHDDIIIGAPFANSNGFSDNGYLIAMSGGVTLMLSIEDDLGNEGIVSGNTCDWKLSGSHEGDKVWFAASTAGSSLTDTGYGFNVLLADPIMVLGKAISDVNGDAVLSVDVPAAAAGMMIWTQAVIAVGHGQFRLSRAVSYPIQ